MLAAIKEEKLQHYLQIGIWYFNNIGLESKIINQKQAPNNTSQNSVKLELIRKFAVKAEWHCQKHKLLVLSWNSMLAFFPDKT